jgi:hypothetical protein
MIAPIEKLRCPEVLAAKIVGGPLVELNPEGTYEFGVHGRMMHFPCKVYDKVELNDRVIVGFEYDELKSLLPEGSDYWCTVCCYDFDGNLLWRVQPAYYIDPDTKQKVICKSIDGAIQTVRYWPSENKLVVYGRMGYEVDPETGELGEIVYRER